MASSTSSSSLLSLSFVLLPFTIPFSLSASLTQHQELLHLHSLSSRSTRGSMFETHFFYPRFSAIRNTIATPISKDLWESSILKSQTPVLAEFYASWCGPCKMLHKVIDEIATEYAGKLKCSVLNTDIDLKIAEEYKITVVPVVLLFKNGRKCEAVTGTMPKEFYVAAIEKMLKP